MDGSNSPQEIFPTVFYRPLCVIRWPINPVLVRHFISDGPCTNVLRAGKMITGS